MSFYKRVMTFENFSVAAGVVLAMRQQKRPPNRAAFIVSKQYGRSRRAGA